MQKVGIWTICFFLAMFPAISEAGKLLPGNYTKFHQNRYFRLIPPEGFGAIRPDGSGVKIFNSKARITIKIHAFEIENPKILSDYELLLQFKSKTFREDFFSKINAQSDRKIKNYRFRRVNGKDIFEVTLTGPKWEINPLRSLVFFEYGRIYQIILEAESFQELKKHSHFLKDVFETIQILE